jgi:hypothetical protein
MRNKLLVGGVTAAVAFLLATNPVVVDAAGQITGAQIKNNSIKGKDVKDHNLAGKDVKADSLTGTEVSEASLGTVPNADKLDNLDSTALTTNTTVANVAPGAGPFATQNWTFTVPAGTYNFDWNVGVVPSAVGNSVTCYLLQGGADYFALEEGSLEGTWAAVWLSASAVRTFAAPTQLAFGCQTLSGTFTTGIGGIQVSYTKLTSSQSGALTAVRPAGNRGSLVSR